MTQDRRSYLRNVSALVASVVGASAAASAGDTPPEWDSETVYTGGDRVVYDGYIWEAEWWTRGTTPSESANVWTKIGPVDGGGGGGELPPAWSAEATYTGGDRVTYEGYIWEAEWWTRGDEPTVEANVWTQVEPVEDPDEPAGPTASFTASEAVVDPGTEVDFDASGSEGSISSYEWSFGDGGTATGEVVSHTFATAGEYTVELTVTNDSGTSDTATDTIVADGGTPTEDRVVGYYMQWSQWDREYYPGDIPLDKVTHVNYAFLTVEQDGAVNYISENAAMRVLEPESWHDHTGFDEIVDDPDTQFLFSIGGWNDSKYFSNAAQTQESRERFANTAVEIMREHDFDGLDIDWEYPGGGGKSGNIVRDGDKQRYTELLQTVRQKLDEAEDEDGQEYLLTTALSADPNKNEGLDHAANAQALDFLNVMTYDYHGAFDDNTNHQAPLYYKENDPSPRADDFNIDASMSFWADTAFDNNQLSLGLPFYGRSFGNVASSDNGGLYQSFEGSPDGTWGQDNGIMEFWDIDQNLEPSGEYEYYWDDTAKVPWIYSESNDVLVSYDNPESVGIKTDYAVENDFGGMMFWTFSGDKNEVLLDTVLDHL
ncbi:glycosyl hydrolase family 18 protein [Haloarchaeobius iranensis]|uniref:Chitinase family 18 n=1 Tax=Haloarchaeobius iranensis TaxID=996166 RepID=A0A1G9UW11_9EURY|nr:glycosyl hydrolase family 18 protein [Haloarchaeobius iranensis]SDM64132.1 chitinase family 18 [Haloarchaeobius iranensis]